MIETDYSDSDFQTDWKDVVWLNTQSKFLTALENGMDYYCVLKSINDSITQLITDDSTYINVKTSEIVFLNAYHEKFIERFSVAIDIGIDLAKAENLQSIVSNSLIGYGIDKWSANLTFSTLLSKQDSTEAIKRNEGSGNFRYNLPKKWYLISTITLLSNTEQKLDMRYNAQQGLGFYFIKSNSAYWGGKVGVNRNIENYSNETADRDSWEAYIGTEINLYDIGDFSLTTEIMFYQGLTEPNRQRVDTNLNLKYDLPYDLYIRMSTSANYDNVPAINAPEFDYVFQTGFGWEL